MKLSDIRIDAVAVEAGDWVDKIPFAGWEGVRFKVRGFGNADYRRLHSKLLRAWAAEHPDEAAADDAADKITIDLLHQAILLDWDGLFEEDDATPLAFTLELSLTLLSDPELPAFRAAVTWAANKVSGKKKVVSEQAEKN